MIFLAVPLLLNIEHLYSRGVNASIGVRSVFLIYGIFSGDDGGTLPPK